MDDLKVLVPEEGSANSVELVQWVAIAERLRPAAKS